MKWDIHKLPRPLKRYYIHYKDIHNTVSFWIGIILGMIIGVMLV